MFANLSLSPVLSTPWTLVGLLPIGVIIWLFTQLQAVKRIALQNEVILQLLQEQLQAKSPTDELLNEVNSGYNFVDESTMRQYQEHQVSLEFEEESDQSSEFKTPHFEDSDSESEDYLKRASTLSLADEAGTGSSGYNTENEVDLEWELYKISRAPLGPVPDDQIYLTFTCKMTGLYVKAVVDEHHSAVHILTFEKCVDSLWNWKKTTCYTCIEKVRRVLADGQCKVPFFIDLELEEDDDEHVSEEEEEANQNVTMDFHESGDEDSKDSEADVDEDKDESDNEGEDVIEKPIATFPSLDDFDFGLEEYHYDYETVLFDQTVLCEY